MSQLSPLIARQMDELNSKILNRMPANQLSSHSFFTQVTTFLDQYSPVHPYNCVRDGFNKLVIAKNNFVNHLEGLCLNQSLYRCAANLSIEPNEKLLSEKTAHLVADGICLEAMIYQHAPLKQIADYIIVSAIKYSLGYLEDGSANIKIPESIHQLITSNFTPIALDLACMAWSLHKGNKFSAIDASTLIACAGGLIGFQLGDKVGEKIAEFINQAMLFVKSQANAKLSSNTSPTIEPTNSKTFTDEAPINPLNRASFNQPQSPYLSEGSNNAKIYKVENTKKSSLNQYSAGLFFKFSHAKKSAGDENTQRNIPEDNVAFTLD